VSAEEEILALEATWHVAPLDGDVETVSRVTADDWIGVGPRGEVMNKRVYANRDGRWQCVATQIVPIPLLLSLLEGDCQIPVPVA
jgi:hypothetical protein